MKIKWMGEFSGDESELPLREDIPNAVPFKEMSAKQITFFMTIVAFVLAIVLLAILSFRGMRGFSTLGIILSLVAAIPHEFLHAICFKDQVYIYTWFKRGALFVVGTESMSKARFIFLGLLPNIVFGFIPYLIALIFPQLAFFGWFGALSIAMGAGDYYNVFNTVTQVPKGALVYLSGFRSYWYLPQDGPSAVPDKA